MKQKIDKDLEQLKSRLKEFEEDRYCPNGCIEYQLDKIELYKQYFGEISESATLISCVLQMNPEFKDSTISRELDKVQRICSTAVDGSKWI